MPDKDSESKSEGGELSGIGNSHGHDDQLCSEGVVGGGHISDILSGERPSVQAVSKRTQRIFPERYPPEKIPDYWNK